MANSVRSRNGTEKAHVGDTTIHAPRVREESARRSTLVRQLCAAPQPVIAITAPAGYGKTTVLTQWAERDAREFVWVLLDEPGAAASLARLAAQFRELDGPLVLVLDNAHLLGAGVAAGAVANLADQLPDGARLVLSGREPATLPLARLRAQGLLLEVGPEQLALSGAEARRLVHAIDPTMSAPAVAELNHRAEGWPVGVVLCALSAKTAAHAAEPTAEPETVDRFVTDYLRLELLDDLTPGQLRFLTRCSVLDRLSGPLCDAMLDRRDSARQLEHLERCGLFLVPLDRHRGWYRFHRMVRQVLEAELELREPGLAAELRTAAADWFEAHQLPELAVDHVLAAGDLDRAAVMVAQLALPAYSSGRASSVERWLAALDDPAILFRHPSLAAFGTWVHATRGRPAEAERWAASATDARLEPGRPGSEWVTLARASLCGDGIERMLTDARRGVELVPADSPLRSRALLLDGCARLLAGDARADPILRQALERSTAAGAAESAMLAASELTLLAIDRADWDEAADLSRLAQAATRRGRLAEYPVAAMPSAIAARIAVYQGDRAGADHWLAQAAPLLPRLTYAVPWLAVQARLEAGRARLGLGDARRALALCSEIDRVFEQRGDLGVLVAQAAELRRLALANLDAGTGWDFALTAAELRLLPLLSTCLSFREIAGGLHLSRNTVKTQALSVYRKLGVSSRSEAVRAAGERGLLEAGRDLTRPAR